MPGVPPDEPLVPLDRGDKASEDRRPPECGDYAGADRRPRECGGDAGVDRRPPERSVDPEVRLQHGRDVAWRALNRRDHTVAEIARLLARKRAEPAVIEAVVGELCEQGYLDDARFARRFAEDRRQLDGWGAERIERRLSTLGIEPELIAAAVGERGHGEELEAALALLRRRFPQPPATPRDCERALGVLVRKGYELELAHDAIRRHAGAPAYD